MRMISNSDYERFGFGTFGPFLLGFTRWLIRQSGQAGGQKICFLARDGYMMKKAWDLLAPAGSPQSLYCRCSRRSLRQSLLHHCGSYRQSLKYLNISKLVSVGNMLSYYGFMDEEIDEAAARFGTDRSYAVPWDQVENCRVFRRLYQGLRGEIHSRSRQQDLLLGQYFDQLGMEGSFTVVDIGWHGSMQYYMEEYFRFHGKKPQISGLYVGNYSFHHLSGPARGYLFDDRDLRLRRDVLCFAGVLEKFFQSREGSAAGYVRRGDRVCVLKEPYEYRDDPELTGRIRALQKGAYAYIRRSARTGKGSTSYERLLRFGMYPTLRETELFQFFYNVDGQKDYFTARKKLWQYRPDQLMHDLKYSPWKTGFMKSLFRLPLPYFWIYRLVS